jgi:hypothetical protein
VGSVLPPPALPAPALPVPPHQELTDVLDVAGVHAHTEIDLANWA